MVLEQRTGSLRRGPRRKDSGLERQRKQSRNWCGILIRISVYWKFEEWKQICTTCLVDRKRTQNSWGTLITPAVCKMVHDIVPFLLAC